MYRLDLAVGQGVWFDFASNAAWENCICVDRLEPALATSIQRSNYNITHGPNVRTMDSFAYDVFGSQQQIWLISGWHKHGKPDGKLPWIQSPMRVKQVGNRTYVQFEDSSDGDFDDIWTVFRPD